MLSLLETYKTLLSEAPFNTSDDLIRMIIRERRVAAFYYTGDEENAPGWRTVECVAFGQGMAKFKSTRDKKYIRAWQRKGKTLSITPGWKFFRTDRIRNWNIGAQTFDTPRPLFNPNGDKTMWRVLAIARFPSGSGGSGTRGNPPAPPQPTPPKKPRITKPTAPTMKPTMKPSQAKPKVAPKTPSMKPVPKKPAVINKPVKPVVKSTPPKKDLNDPSYF